MITIICCSINSKLAEKLTRNVTNTIGEIKYEFLIHDNLNKNEPISKVYNRLMLLAKYEIIVLLHEDIEFITYNWGLVLFEIFKNKDVSLLGIAGSTLKLKSPSYWSDVPENFHYKNIVQKKDGNFVQETVGFCRPNTLIKASVIDGVFMAVRRAPKLKILEGEGFHGYDISLSLECVKRGLGVYITNSVLIKHFSTGDKNISWLRSIIKMSDHYSNFLPSFNEKISLKELKRLEGKALLKTTHIALDMRDAKVSKSMVFRAFKSVGLWNKIVLSRRLMKLYIGNK